MAQSKTLKDRLIRELIHYKPVVIKDTGDPDPSFSTIILYCLAKAKKYDQLTINNHH